MRIHLVAAPDAAHITADAARRRITGRLVPFGETAAPSHGPALVEFAADGTHESLEDVWLNREHNDDAVLGKAATVDVRDDGIWATFDILATTAGTDALTEAAAGARAGLSVEADIVAHEDRGGTVVITRSLIHGAALVRRPAFPSAGITDVAATAANGTEEPEEAPEVNETPAVAEAAEQVAASAAPIRLDITQRDSVPSAGEFILASVSRDPVRLAEATRRVRAAAPHTFVAEVPGLIPEAIVGPVMKLRDGSAPLFNALGPNTAPAGKSFTIPYVDPALPAAATANEKSDVTKQLGVKEVQVVLDFVKVAVNLSAEAVAFSQPSIIDVAVMELADAIALGCEANVATKLQAVTGTNTAVSIAVNGSDAWAKLSGGQAAAYAATGRSHDLFVAAPDVWAKIAGFANSLGAPLIGGINQTLTGDPGNLFGMRVVVSSALTAGKSFMVTTAGVKSWSNASVTMRVDEPTILGYALGAGQSVGLSVASPKMITPVTVAAAV